MLMDEGLDNVFARHERHAEATRRAVRAWGLEIQCLEPREYSPVLTGVVMPEGHDADAVRKVILEKFDMSLGAGLGKDRKSVVSGKSVSVRVELGGPRTIKNKKQSTQS